MSLDTSTVRFPIPLKLVVIGASKGTGKAIVEEALSRNHWVTAVARTPSVLTVEHVRLTKVAADVTDPKSLVGLFDGAAAVLVALGATLGALKKDPTLFSRGTQNVIDAMRAANVKRGVLLTSNGTGDSRNQIPFLLRLLVVDGILKRAFVDHGRQEEVCRSSGLDWTIARPGQLTNGPSMRAYQVALDAAKVPRSISRADVAHFMVNAAESKELIGKTAALGG